MFNTEDFKKSVLDRAMRGKLTQQLPEDGDAKDLLNQIDAEKKTLIKDKKIKAQKPLPEINADEIPFEVPDNWQWVRLGDISNIIMGQSPKSKDVSDGIPDNDHFEFHQGKSFFNEKIIGNSNKVTTSRLRLTNKDYILMSVRAPVGDVNLTSRTIALGRGLCGIKPICINKYYLYYYLMTQKNYLMRKSTGSTFKAINKKTIFEDLVPIPTLPEQKRIVKNIDKCFDLANHIDQEDSLTDNFNVDMRKSLLQSAMMGKLTKQLPKDGDASELLKQIKDEKASLVKAKKIKAQKPLPEIDADEIPFEIPDNWRWVRLGEIYSILQVPTVSKNQYKENGIPFYRIKDIVSLSKGIKPSIDIFISKEDYFKNIKNKGTVKSGDILITATGTLGTTFIVENDEPMYFQGSNNIIWLKNITNFNSKFINIILQSNEFSIQIKKMAKGSTLKHLSIGLLSNLPIPLPPLSEQNRIVNKLDKLLDELKG